MYSWYGRGTWGVSGELSWKLPENWDVHDVVVHGFVMNARGDLASVSVGLVVGGGRSCCSCLF